MGEAMQKHVSELEQEKKQQEKELQKAREQISSLESESKAPTIVTDDTQMKEALEKSLQVEKELRAANRALEKALAEEKEKSKKLKKKDGEVATPTSRNNQDIEDAIKEVTEQYEKKLKDQDRKIEKLEAEVERLKAELEEAGSN